jgi:cell division protein FtsB
VKLTWKKRLLIIMLIFLAGAAYITFNENGLLSYMKLKDKLTDINAKADSMDQKIRRLEEEIDSLNRKVPAKIEQTAREKYDMLRKGETKIEIIER